MFRNYTFTALTMKDGQPVAGDPVAPTDRPEMPARKAQAWASENTGRPKDEIERQISKAMK